MKTNLNLSIPNPCTEQWDNFTPTQNGGYCGSCFKTVVDFTRMSDAEIVDFLKTKPAHACGRFRSDQLKAYTLMPPAKVTPGMTLLKAGLFGLLLAIVSKPASGQSAEVKATTETIQTSKNKNSSMVSDTTRHPISGIIKSAEDGERLPGVNVVLKGTTIGTVTDAEGRFDFPEKLKVGDVLFVSFIGLESKEIAISKRMIENAAAPIEMALCLDVAIMGEIEVAGLYGEEKGIFRRWWSRLKSAF